MVNRAIYREVPVKYKKIAPMITVIRIPPRTPRPIEKERVVSGRDISLSFLSLGKRGYTVSAETVKFIGCSRNVE